MSARRVSRPDKECFATGQKSPLGRRLLAIWRHTRSRTKSFLSIHPALPAYWTGFATRPSYATLWRRRKRIAVEANSQAQQSRWFPLIAAIQAILAVPAMTLVLIGPFGLIQFTYGTFFVAKIIIVALFLFGIVTVVWSVRGIKARLRGLHAAAFVLHCLSFAVLTYWFGGVHRL